MKNFNIVTLVLGIAINCSAQTTSTHDCSNDSAENKLFLVFLDTCKLNNFHPFDVHEHFFKPKLNDDCFCNLLCYTLLFDYLLINGLDLKYSFFKNIPYTNSTNLPEDSEHVMKLKSNNTKDHLYYSYLVFKLKYDENVIAQYEKDKSRSLAQDITNILKFNIYSRPASLKGILLIKNGRAQSEQYNKEVEMILGKD